MIHNGNTIRACLSTSVLGKYEYYVNGKIVLNNNNSLMYDAISGDESFWDEEDYERAIPIAQYLIDLQ